MDLYDAFRFLLTVYFYTVVSITFIASLVLQCVEGIVLLPLLLIKPKLRVVILGQTHQALMELGRQQTPSMRLASVPAAMKTEVPSSFQVDNPARPRMAGNQA